MNCEVGKEYKIYHTRKGHFFGKVIQIDGEWVDIMITKGTAKAMLIENEREAGEMIRARLSHCTFSAIGTKGR